MNTCDIFLEAPRESQWGSSNLSFCHSFFLKFLRLYERLLVVFSGYAENLLHGRKSKTRLGRSWEFPARRLPYSVPSCMYLSPLPTMALTGEPAHDFQLCASSEYLNMVLYPADVGICAQWIWSLTFGFQALIPSSHSGFPARALCFSGLCCFYRWQLRVWALIVSSGHPHLMPVWPSYT